MNYNVDVRKIQVKDFLPAIDVYTEAFSEDPLHILLFPELDERIRITKLFYEMMVNEFVHGLNLQLMGVYENNVLAAAIIYSRPDSYDWNDDMMKIVIEMRKKADNDNVSFVSEYTIKANEYKPQEKHFYINELAVGKNHRGKGYAKMLITCTENDAVNFPDVKLIGLDTSNPVNVEIYKKLGYTIFMEFPFYKLNGYVMRKTLPHNTPINIP